MEEKKKMNLDEMKKAKMPLNNEEMSMVSGAGDGLWMVSGDPECPDCPGTKIDQG